LLYLAFKLAAAKGIGVGRAGAKPMTFLQAFAFQAINPKGWAMALGAVSTYLPRGYGLAALGGAVLIFGAAGAPSSLAWAGFGVGLRRFLDRPAVLRALT